MTINCPHYEYFPTLESTPIFIRYKDGATEEVEHQLYTEPDFDAVMTAIARRYRLSEAELDVGAERRDGDDDQYEFHVYHPAHGMLAKVSYNLARY